MSKESIGERVATLTERINNLIKTNSEEHEDIFDAINKLSEHVNDRHESYTENLKAHGKRLKILEESKIGKDSKYAGRIELLKWISMVIGLVSGALGLVILLVSVFPL